MPTNLHVPNDSFDLEKSHGTMKKLTDVTKLHGLGWKHKVEMKNGIEKMYNWYKELIAFKI